MYNTLPDLIDFTIFKITLLVVAKRVQLKDLIFLK